ncbi:MAG: hypothetical protein C5B59_20810 [Bacteroidetes bacterium]|nr:MAG: hypothetical protein C5B59_20810 [Bacteroidota bacterium]
MAEVHPLHFSEKVLFFIERNFKVISLVIICIQVLKGTALYEHAYARSQYLWSYEYGFIKRGLIGTLVLWLNEDSLYRILGIINFFSYLSYFLFLYLLFHCIQQHSTTILQKIMALLLLASPLIIAIGSLLGYFDALILSILIYAYLKFKGKKIPVIPFILFAALALSIHELALFFVVIPLLYLAWESPHTDKKRKNILIVATILICLVYVVSVSGVNEIFNLRFAGRIEKYKHVLSTKTGENFFTFFAGYALNHSFLHDFKILRLGMLVPLLPVYGFFILISNWLVLQHLLPQKKYMESLLYLAACYGPLLIIVVGWDVDRFVCLSICTSFIVLLVVMDSHPTLALKKPGPLHLLFFALVVAVALLTYYPISENYAEGETLISKNRQRVLLQYPDKWINNWKKLVLPYQSKFYPPANNQ